MDFLYDPISAPLPIITAKYYRQFHASFLNGAGAVWPGAAPSVWKRYGVCCRDEDVLRRVLQIADLSSPVEQSNVSWRAVFSRGLDFPIVDFSDCSLKTSSPVLLKDSEGVLRLQISGQILFPGEFTEHETILDLYKQMLDEKHLGFSRVRFEQQNITYFYDSAGYLIAEFRFIADPIESPGAPRYDDLKSLDASSILFTMFSGNRNDRDGVQRIFINSKIGPHLGSVELNSFR